jgi:hypothetical protein
LKRFERRRQDFAGRVRIVIREVSSVNSRAWISGVDSPRHDPTWCTLGAGERSAPLLWAGDQKRISPDFLAVVDFDADSQRYGEVIRTVPVPGPGASGNEPHHVGLSSDGRTLAAGGLLSVLKGQNEIFFFDVSRPARPRFLSSANPPQSAITDEFYALPDGGFLVTMMGGAEGHHPGRVVEFDRDGQIVAEHPQRLPDDGFNPHGISVRPELNLMVTSDFICPSTTLNAVPGLSTAAASGVVAGAAVDRQDDRDPGRRRHDRRAPDPRRSQGSCVHRGHAGRPAVPARHARRPGDAGLRFHDDRARRLAAADSHDPRRHAAVHHDERRRPRRDVRHLRSRTARAHHDARSRTECRAALPRPDAGRAPPVIRTTSTRTPSASAPRRRPPDPRREGEARSPELDPRFNLDFNTAFHRPGAPARMAFK